MIALRQRMIEYMQLHGLAPRTQTYYYVGGAPIGGRKRLAALRHWLVNTYPDRDELGEPGESKEPAISAPALAVRCPNCGQAMRLEHIIQPTGRCPP